MNKTCGVYRIRNKVNDKVIIGSSVRIERRWWEYTSGLNKGNYENDHLQKSWNKYGKDSFEFTIIEECPEDKLIEREDYWIAFYDSMNGDKGYNLQGADRQKNSRKGFKHSEETKRRIGLASKGNIQSSETRLKRSISCKLAFQNPSEKMLQARLKHSIAMKGRPTWNKGKKDIYSEESLLKMSKAKLGNHYKSEYSKNH